MGISGVEKTFSAYTARRVMGGTQRLERKHFDKLIGEVFGLAIKENETECGHSLSILRSISVGKTFPDLKLESISTALAMNELKKRSEDSFNGSRGIVIRASFATSGIQDGYEESVAVYFLDKAANKFPTAAEIHVGVQSLEDSISLHGYTTTMSLSPNFKKLLVTMLIEGIVVAKPDSYIEHLNILEVIV